MRRFTSRLISWVACLLVGGVFGVAGAVSHSWAPFFGIPLGFAIAFIADLAMLLAVRLLTLDRMATFAAGVGMLGMTLVISGAGPGGSVIVQNTVLGNIWVYTVAALAIIVAAWPSFSAQPARAQAAANTEQ